MKFYLDENFPRRAHALLTGRGHEVMDLRGGPDEGMDDPDIFHRAQENQAAFLTTDKDFFHTVPLLFPHHHGVVVIALRQPTGQGILDKLTWFLEHFPEGAIPRHVFLLKDRSYVVRPALDG